MNKLAPQRRSRPLLPQLPDLLNGLSPFAGLRQLLDNHVLRLEDETRDGLYRLRAELPGIDPIESLEVTVSDGLLTIKAERPAPSESNGRSEFTYGTFERTVPLPPGADEDDIHASYDRGILTISVPLSDTEAATKHIEVIETITADEDDDDYDDDDAEVIEADQLPQPVS